jgi:hypothetical protein
VTALDRFNNTATGYSGVVTFSTSDHNALVPPVLPANSQLTAGVGTFSATLSTAGSQTITATDNATSSITGASNAITVSAAAATHFAVTAPSPVGSGSGFAFTVVAEDKFNNIATSYPGTVTFTDSATGASLPANATLTNGTGTFSATLNSAVTQTLSATDTVTPSITGSAVIVVSSTQDHFVLTTPNSITAGQFTFTLTAETSSGTTDPTYSGTVHFSSSDAHGILPANTTLVGGQGVFSATLETAATQTLTAADTAATTITAATAVISVNAGAATHLVLNAPSTANAGSGFSFTVTAEDQFNNTDTHFAASVLFTNSAAGATLPAPSLLTSGTGAFSATLSTAGAQTLSATDTQSSLVTGSAVITVTSTTDHLVLSTPSSVVAGATLVFTVTAENTGNFVDTSYAGTVTFSSSDSSGILPANVTLTNGQGIFSATLKTAATQTLTAADTVGATITAGTSTITVVAANTTHYSVNAPSAATAGAGFSFTVTALDQFNNVAKAYSGTVAFTTSDHNAVVAPVLPANSTLTNGVGTFSATLSTAGSQTITATDTTIVTLITGNSGTINVSAAAASHFSVVAANNATAGVSFGFTVTALDPFNNTATSYTGVVAFSTSDQNSVVAPTLPTISGLPNGVGTFSATLSTAGSQTITATDIAHSTLTGASNTIRVVPAAASHFMVAAPGAATAGTGFAFTVTALDPFNNTAAGYTGQVAFTTSDHNTVKPPVLPANSLLTAGVGTFSATLSTVGSQTLTATDNSVSSITGHSGTITVSAGAATHFAVNAPGSATPGTGFSFNVTAEDAANNTATGYAGTVVFTNSAAGATLPANSTLTNGTGTFSATLNTGGIQTLTAADSVTPSINGTAVINVGVTLDHLVINAPSNAAAGTAFTFTVIAENSGNIADPSYKGTVTFSSSDSIGVLPGNTTLTNGQGIFSATLKTAANQTLTAADTVGGTITAATATITVSAATSTHFTVNATSAETAGVGFAFTVTALDQFGNTAKGYTGTVVFTTSDHNTVVAPTLPANATLVNGVGTFSATLTTSGSQTLTATDSVTATTTGHSNTITISPAATSHFALSDPTHTAGIGFPFTVTAQDPFNNMTPAYTGTVVFSSTDHNLVVPPTLPAPSTLSAGISVFSATLTTAGTQTIFGTDSVTSSLTGNTGPITILPSAVITHFAVQGPPTIQGGVGFTFTVMAEDQFNNTAPNYTGSVKFTSTDSAATLSAPGSLTAGVGTFSATLQTSGTQFITATDTVTATLTGHSNPINVVTIPPGVFLSIPSGIAVRGGTVSVPININQLFDPTNNLQQSGLSGATFVVFYNTSVFQQLAPADVNLGVLPDDPSYSTANGWQLSYVPPPAGLPQGVADIFISPPGTGSLTTTGGGSLVVLNFHVLANAPLGNSSIDLAADQNGPNSTPATFVSDSFDTQQQGGLRYDLQPDPNSNAALGIVTNPSSGSSNGPADNTGDTQTITFGGTVNNGSTFELGFAGATTGPIAYSNNPTTLQNNIQTALTNNPNVGEIVPGVSNVLVVANSATSVTVTFQGFLGFGNPQPTMTWSSNLTGTNASVSVADTGFGYYGLASNDPAFFDPTDGTINISGANTAPTANNDSYSITERDFASDPGLSVPAGPIGITANDTSPIGNTLNPSLVSGPSHGVVVVNGDQTITFGSTEVTGDTFQLMYANFTTAPITYSTNTATLQANIQSALNKLITGTPIVGFGTPAVSATSNTSVTVTFTSPTNVTEPPITVYGATLSGANPTVSVASEGSFVYTPVTGYLGADSFTYTSTDSGTGLVSNVATVNLTVTPRLSIPTNIVTTQGATVTVPVNIDNPNPSGSGGLIGATEAVVFNPNVLQVSSVILGSATNGNAVQTISFGTGFTNTTTFELVFSSNPASVGSTQTTGPITYSSTPATLSANIQAALNALSLIGSGNTLVTAQSASTVTVAFQGARGGHVQNTMQGINTGAGPAPTVVTTVFGFTAWTESTPSIDNTRGLLGVAEGASAGPNVNTIGGSLIQIVFTVLNNAPGGVTPVYLVQSVTPNSLTVTSALNVSNTSYLGLGGNLPIRPGLSQPVVPVSNIPNNPFPSFVVGVDGTVVVAPYFQITAPATVAAGAPFAFTVSEIGANNTVNTGYNGTVQFSSTDSLASFIPPSTTLTNGTGVFTATLVTGGNQELSATDVQNSTITGTSNPILVSTVAQDHFVVTGPSNATAGSGFNFTVVAETPSNAIDTSYSGTVHFTSSDSLATSGNGLPANTTLNNGQGIFIATLKTAGHQTLVATDVSSALITGSTTITVSAAPASHFSVGAPTTANAGTGFAFTVTALDPFNNVANSYAGTVVFTNSAAGATLPANSTLVNGTGTFSATLNTAGSQTLTAADSVTSTINGTAAINVIATSDHLVLSAPGNATAGANFVFTVTAENSSNAIDTGYKGTVTFSSSDSIGVLPANITLVNGQGIFSATLKTAATQTLTAADTVGATITAGTTTITVSAAAASHFTVNAPSAATAGTGFGFTVTALDPFNNVAKGYTGIVTFTTSDHNTVVPPVLPANSTLVNGVGTFNATLSTVGSQTITATDSAVSSITGASNAITVSAAAATHFAVAAPGSAAASAGFAFTVTAEDKFNNTATSYTGIVHFTNSAAGATLPANSSLTNGTGTFSATLTTAGSQTLSATDTVTTTITGSAVINVTTVLDHFVLSAPGSITAGGFTFTLTAETSANVVDPTYTGTVHFSSSDAQGILPANTTLVAGQGIFSATLKTAATQTLTAADTVSSSITAATAVITVNAGAASHFVVNAPNSATAGVGLSFTVTAEDQFNNTATSYPGTVVFTTSDHNTVIAPKLPANSTLNAGVGVFSATLSTAGGQTLTATDSSANTLTGASNTITVSAAAASHFNVATPGAATAGVGFGFTVTALDPFNNTATSFTGSVNFTSSDKGALTSLPHSTPLVAGVGLFNATLTTAGAQTITATDLITTTITGHSGTITVSAATATHFAVVAPGSASSGASFGFTVTAEDQFNNVASSYAGNVNFTASGVGTTVPGTSTLTNGTGTFNATFKSAGLQTLSATDTVTATITGSAVINIATVLDHFVLSAPSSTTAGGFTFTLIAETSANVVDPTYTGTVQFSSSDAQGILPANTTLVAGQGIFSATLKTAATQTLTAADTVSSSITAATAVITVNAGAASHFVVSAPSSATAGVSISFTVTAEDQFNNTATGYTGIVGFASSDKGASTVLPANSGLTNGTGTFNATLTTAGSQTITATDTGNATLTGNSGTITVSAAAASHFAVAAPGAASAGVAFSFTVTAEDKFNNVATSYAGTVAFSSSDKGAATVLPGNSTLLAGTATFNATLTTAGNQFITATDKTAGTLTGQSNAITVSAAAATHFGVAAPVAVAGHAGFQFTVTAEDQFNNTATSYAGSVKFSSSDAGAVLPVPNVLSAGVGTFTATLATAGSQTITATDSVNATITGHSGPIVVAAGATTHFSVLAPTSATAGAGFTFTVDALDASNNISAGYTGIVVFTSSDAGTSTHLPASTTLVNGVGVFSATLTTAGNQTITATDSATNTITGHSGSIVVSAAAASNLNVSAPGSAAAGTGFSFNVTALDPFGNLATGYTGTVVFTSTDLNPSTTLPAASPLTAGQGTFSATLTTAGAQTLIATDQTTSSITGHSGPITVTAGTATHFAVTAPIAAAPGVGFSFVVTAEDKFNNTATSYTGTVHFTKSDPSGSLPSDSTLIAGTRTFSATLQTQGNQTLIATDTVNATINGSAVINVNNAQATHFVISIPSSAVAGTSFVFTVTAENQFNVPAPTYTGTVHFSSSDHNTFVPPVLPANSTLNNGVGIFSATLTTAGLQTITAADTVNSAITAGTGTIQITPNPTPGRFVVTNFTGSTTTAGAAIVEQVVVYDQFNNFDTAYNGTLHFTTNDPLSTSGNGLPNDTPLVNLSSSPGIGYFAVVLKTATTTGWTISVNDVSTPSVTGASAPIKVVAGAATQFIVTPVFPGYPANPNGSATGSAGGPSQFANIGGPLQFSVSAEDLFGNLANTYTGTMQFTSSDPAATLPTPSTLLNGKGTFSATMRTASNQTIITATDVNNPSVTGATGPFAVRGLVVTGFKVTPTGFTLTFNQALNPGTLALYGSTLVTANNPTGAIQAANGQGIDIAVVDRSTPVVGSFLFEDPSNPSINPNYSALTFVAGNGVLNNGPLDLYTVTLSPTVIGNASKSGVTDALGDLLDGLNTGSAGNFVQNFRSVATTAAAARSVLSIASFARGPGNGNSVPGSLNFSIPNSAVTGIPVRMTNSGGVTSETFTLNYNPLVLTINGTMPGVTNGTFSVSFPGGPAAGVAVFQFTDASGLPATTNTLGYIEASIPTGAVNPLYGTKDLLHLSQGGIAGTTNPVYTQDGVQVDAYLGDVVGAGTLITQDASDIQRVASALDSGFAQYPLLNPAIIASLTNTNNVNGSDASLILANLSGATEPLIPPQPFGSSVSASGPDPALSVQVPSGIQPASGDTITVPVDIDTAHPDGSSGIVDAVLALQFDPQVFSVSTSDVELGTVPSGGTGWHMITAVNDATGQIGVELFSQTPIQSTTAGSLVTVSLHVRDQAPAGTTALSLVTQVAPEGQRVFETELVDNSGALVLHQALTAQGTEPGVPGQLTILDRGNPGATAGVSTYAGQTDVTPNSLSSFDVQSTAALAASASAVPLALMEKVFGNLDQTAQVIQETALGQPGPLLSGDSSERSLAGVRDLAQVQASALVGQQEWLPDDYAAFLGLSSQRALMGGVPALLDNAVTGLDDPDDLAGLDAFFAREAAGGRSRIQ